MRAPYYMFCLLCAALADMYLRMIASKQNGRSLVCVIHISPKMQKSPMPTNLTMFSSIGILIACLPNSATGSVLGYRAGMSSPSGLCYLYDSICKSSLAAHKESNAHNMSTIKYQFQALSRHGYTALPSAHY